MNVNLKRANKLQKIRKLQANMIICPNCLKDDTDETKKHKIHQEDEDNPVTPIYTAIHQCNHCGLLFIVNHKRFWFPASIELCPTDTSDFYE